MHIKILQKKVISCCVAVLSAVALTGCFDLGDFDDEEAYYATFDEIRLVYQNPTSEEKDVQFQDYEVDEYFYNKNTGEDFSYGNPDDDEPDEGKHIPQLSYLYMAIPVEKDLSMDSFALYFNAQQADSLEIYFYVVDSLPNDGRFTTIKLFGEPETQTKLDDEGKPELDENGNPIEEPIAYSDPDETCFVGRATAYVKEYEWTSVVVDTWNGASTLQIKESQYLLLRFINNGALRKEGQSAVSFNTTNMLVRADS